VSTPPQNFTAPLGAEPAWDIATLFPPQGSWTVDEYLDFTDDTNRLIEYTDGQIEVVEMECRQIRLQHLGRPEVVAGRGEIFSSGRIV
jgi:hypothetical protein